MEKFNRAVRRHHAARLKKKRANYGGGIGHLTAEELPGRLGQLVATPAACSCAMCGNPRKYLLEPSLAEQSFAALQRKCEGA